MVQASGHIEVDGGKHLLAQYECTLQEWLSLSIRATLLEVVPRFTEELSGFRKHAAPLLDQVRAAKRVREEPLTTLPFSIARLLGKGALDQAHYPPDPYSLRLTQSFSQHRLHQAVLREALGLPLARQQRGAQGDGAGLLPFQLVRGDRMEGFRQISIARSEEFL